MRHRLNPISTRRSLVRSRTQVGDIVLCPGKWASQDMVGLVTATQVNRDRAV